MATKTSTSPAVTKRFSKQDLFEELARFMPTFACSVERMYGTGAAFLMRSATIEPSAPNLEALQATPLWRSLSELYDYAFDGVLPAINQLGDGSLVDVEMFLAGIDGLTEFLAEDDGDVPKFAKRTVLVAQGRQILDGDTPYLDFVADRPADHLSLTQVALLGGVSAEWVRESASLATGQQFVPVEMAREWLCSCAVFVATGAKLTAAEFRFSKSISVDIPLDIVRALQERAGISGLSPNQVLRIVFAEEIARDERYSKGRSKEEA